MMMMRDEMNSRASMPYLFLFRVAGTNADTRLTFFDFRRIFTCSLKVEMAMVMLAEMEMEIEMEMEVEVEV